MWKQDLEALLKAWPEDRLISKITAVYGGIAITDTEGVHWHYNNNEGTLTRLPNRKQRGGPSSIEAFVSSYELALEDEDDE